ncbi:MAG: hypothetical protein QOJ46_130 [bacterium]|jgi:hypothetical protein
MLFDLRGRGRRRTVQAIYLSLALLMGGGLVLFGIGSSSNGGLFEGLFGSGGATNTATENIDKQIKSALAKTRATPTEPAVWANLARLRIQRAGIDGVRDDGTYTTKGKEKLSLAADAWEQHLSLNPKTPDLRVARLMVQVYGQGALNELTKAVQAQQLVTAAEKPPSTGLYQQLAQLAYQAGDTRTGDLAASRAVDLAPAKDRKALRTALDQLKTQAAAQPPQPATTPSG